jgi:hypothetical protein
MPAINATALGATSIDAAAIILRFFCDSFFCFRRILHAFAGYETRRIASLMESPGCSIK